MNHRSQKAAVVGALLFTSCVWGSTPFPRLHVGGAAAHAGNAKSQKDYVLSELLPGMHGQPTQAVDISNNKMVGGIYAEGDQTLTFVWYGGRFVSIQHKDAQFTLMGAVTNSGMAVGNYGSETVQHAALFNIATGGFIELPDHDAALHKPFNMGWRMNDAGTVVGTACESSEFHLSVFHNCTGWIWNGGPTYSYIDYPGATRDVGTTPTSINNRGQITGYYSDVTGHRSFLYDHGVFTTLELPNNVHSEAYDINNEGQILVFTFPDSSFGFSGLYDRGVFTELPNFPGSLVTVYLGMNDAGELVGLYVDAEFLAHAFSARKN